MRSRDIIDMITKPASPMIQGAAMAAARFAPGSPQEPSRSQRAFLDAVSGQKVPAPRVHTHPASAPGPLREPGPLTPVELAWLSRFAPDTDPSKVSFEDAKALATLDRTIDPMKLPADSRLVRAVWQPVLEHHDRAAADAAMENASRPLAPIPSSALGALADAVASENNQLTPDEAQARAKAMLGDAQSRRERDHEQAIEYAREAQMAVDGRQYERTVVDV